MEKIEPYSDEYFYCELNKNRYIMLYNEITDEVAEIIITKIRVMNMLNNKPIFIEINSPGGSVSSGMAIISAIKDSKAKIVTIVNGEACSMAAAISIFGKERWIYENSFWMEHPVSDMVADDVCKIKDRTQFLIKADKAMDIMFKERTKLTSRDITKIHHGELWLSAKEALAKGVADKII